jgi:hypothetical protein
MSNGRDGSDIDTSKLRKKAPKRKKRHIKWSGPGVMVADSCKGN